MATTEKLPSGKHRGVYYDAAGKKRHTPAKERKRDALNDAREAEVKAKRQAAVSTGTVPGYTTWGQWCEVWWESRGLEPSTAANEATIRDRELLPQWENVPLNQISRQSIQNWVNGLAKRKSVRGAPNAASYVQRIYSVFRASILAAVDEEVLLASPCIKIRTPKVAKTRKRHFERSEYEAFLPKLRVRHREAVEFLWETGLRPGEFAGLHWDHVSLDSGWITVADVLLRSGKTIKSRPKDEDAREVPLTSRAVELLKKWQTDIPPSEGCGLPHSNGRACRSDLVYRQLNGSPLSLTSLRDVFARALERAGVAAGSPYDLRHSFATRLAEAGVDAYEISRLMGHATINQSMVYIHRTASARLRVLAALGDSEAAAIRLVDGVGRGIDRGMSGHSSALPDTPSGASPHAS